MSKRLRRLSVTALGALLLAWALVAAGAERSQTPPAQPPKASAAEAAAAQAPDEPDALELTPMPEPPKEASVARPPLPQCEVADEPARLAGHDEWRSVVLDTRFMLPPDYAPADLVELNGVLADISPFVVGHGHSLRSLVVPDLRALLQAAEDAGVHLEIQSAYRSYDYQKRTFDRWVAEDGYEQALRSSARAGHSEHQLGTVVDMRTRGGPSAWDLPDWAATPEGAWMGENAWRFGFALSYPAGKEGATCYMYEPWHFRYLGRELAAAVHASGLAPREYLWSVANHDE